MLLLGDPLLSVECLGKAHIERLLKGKRSGQNPLDKKSKKVVLYVESIECPN